MVDINWSELGFKYVPTKCHIAYEYKNGKWGEGQLKEEPNITMNIAASCLHYGQALFEGLKAYRCKDGKVRVFRDDENSKRLNSTANYVCCPEVPYEMFKEAVDAIVTNNEEYIPPYGTGGALYIRPLLIGTGPVMGVSPSEEYTFIMLGLPVGPYYKGGISPIDAIILDDYDRAAPNGSGSYKVAGNYGAGMYSSTVGKKKGFPIVLFLDSKTHTCVDEFTTTNFIAITKDNEYVTPDSSSVLPSITNMSLFDIAQDFGMKSIRRPVSYDELQDLAEVGACGTAAVLTPIGKIAREGHDDIEYSKECGPVLMKLYNTLRAIQYGETPDTHNWTRVVL